MSIAGSVIPSFFQTCTTHGQHATAVAIAVATNKEPKAIAKAAIRGIPTGKNQNRKEYSRCR